ncbi:MAG: hypothetical protein KF716_31230 [Anaerolineae bacterium]|nr:hypothetical protein [Anaerolineae bacterium]
MRSQNPNNEDTDDYQDNPLRHVVDYSEEWLAEVEAAQLFPPDIWKKASDAQKLAARKTKFLLRFVKRKPTYQAIKHKVNDIFETLQFATGIPKVIYPVVLIMDALLTPLEQLGEWNRLEAWFLQMYPILVDKAPTYLPRWRQWVIRHCRYTGHRRWRDNTIDDLLEDGVLDPHEHGLMVLLRSTTSAAECKRVTAELLKIAKAANDPRLMMEVHTQTATRHLEDFELAAAFEHAQQAFCLATLLNDGCHLALTAAIMASVFVQHLNDPRKALGYADLAMDHAVAIRDPQWVLRIRGIRAFCLHTLKQHEDAIRELNEVLPKLDSRGIVYARALYMWCAALSYLNPTKEQFVEIEDKLVTALDIFVQQQSYPDILSAQMALVQTFIDAGEHRRAWHYYRQAVKPLITDQKEKVSTIHQYYVDALEKQLNALDSCA